MIPDFQSIMLPFLQFAEDGREHSIHEVHDALAIQFRLTDQEIDELLPSGRQKRFYNRVGWARAYLKESGLITSPKRGYIRITDRGIQVLRDNPARIDMNYLERFPEYLEFRSKGSRSTKESEDNLVKGPDKVHVDNNGTPEEILEGAYQEIRESLAQELLQQISECSDSFFERLVVEVLVAMGYGGSQREAARAVGKAGDEGIDGIIDEDRLGLDTVYIQAKKWQETVGRPEIQKFVGALTGQRASKGVFITTSSFSSSAYDYASKIDKRVVLIDGRRLTEYMIDYNVGVSTVDSYQIKRIDTDHFENQ